MTAGLPLMKSVLSPLVKNVLLPFGLSAPMSATDAKNGSNGRPLDLASRTTALIIFKWRNGRYKENG